MGVITAGGVGYYLDTVASGVDDYYARAEPGRWLGAGAAALGIEGEVDAGQVGQLAAGVDPASGAPLGPRPSKVVALDLTFSAPKGVSLLGELSDPATRRAVRDGHDRAVAATVGFLESDGVLVGRRGAGGARQVAGVGAIAAGFVHRTSRAGDPQLHTHVLVFNRMLGVDGRWGAVHSRRVFAWAKTAGYIYQAALRAELTRALGVEWKAVANGTADVAGITDAQTDAFSTRRAQIETALETAGATTPRAAQIATLATRPARPDPIDPEIQRKEWLERAGQIGLDVHALQMEPAAPRPPEVDIPRLAGEHGPTGHRSVFDRRHLLQALADHAPAGASPEVLAGQARLALADPAFVALDADSGLAGQLYTTRELVNLEGQVLDGFDRRRHTNTAVCRADIVESVIAARATLSVEQEEMVRRLCSSGHGVEVVVGRAGTGKTYALDTARQAWTAQQVPVIGAALAARTAAGLQADTGIPSATVDQLLADLGRPGADALPRRGVLVVDEAGMVGTRHLAALLDAAERASVKVVLVGDPRQLPEVSAGGAFAALAGRAEPIELTVNRRQTLEWERRALDRLRHGDVAAAVSVYRDRQRITLTPTADAARARLVADWWTSFRRHGPDRSVMVALTRADVADLNHLARLELRAAGRLGEDVQVGARAFAVGDLVMAGRNDRRLGVTNGTRAQVTAITPDRITVRTLDGRDVHLPAGYAADGHLDHGYCLTAHKAQGITVTDAFVLGSDRLYREAGYTALSRATEHTQLYQVAPIPPAWQPAIAADPDAELTRLLTRSQAQQLAVDHRTVDQGNIDHRTVDPIALRDAALADPGPHLLTRLGPPPPAGRSRDAWAAAATAIDTYRRTYRIDGPEPLGPRPADPGQARAWEHARALTRAVESPTRPRPQPTPRPGARPGRRRRPLPHHLKGTTPPVTTNSIFDRAAAAIRERHRTTPRWPATYCTATPDTPKPWPASPGASKKPPSA